MHTATCDLTFHSPVQLLLHLSFETPYLLQFTHFNFSTIRMVVKTLMRNFNCIVVLKRNSILNNSPNLTNKFMSCAVCVQEEFAESLAMKPDSVFINQMFSLIDRDRNGYISFRELLYAVVLFSKGNTSSTQCLHSFRHGLV